MDIEIDEVKRLRKQHNLTQTQLAKLTNISQSLIAKLESGKIDPSYTKVKKILDILHSLSIKNEPKVCDIMISKVISVSPKDNLSKAIKKMKDNEISQIPVMQNENVVGLISETTVIEQFEQGHDPRSMLIEQIMADAPPIINKKTPLKIVADLLKHSPIVVVAENGKAKGVATKADILKSYKN